jgi:hypothetical protein
MTDLPLNILTDAGFTGAEARSIVDHLVQGVDMHDPAGPDRLNIEGLPDAKKEAYTRFVEAVTPDA